jgi:hypothetical protein
VTDVIVSFTGSKTVAEPVKRRSQEEAKALAQEYVNRLRSGTTPDAIKKEAEARQDRGVAVVQRRLRRHGNDILLFERANESPERQWTGYVELIAAYHVLRKEGFTPAPKYEDAVPLVREKIVGLRTSLWLQDAARDQIQIATR